jgi:predicted NAD-dependent protein-ADP-ribosyltransferase YbiA (DUF1768 family)
MVVSELDNTVTYSDTTAVMSGDEHTSRAQFVLEVAGVDAVVTVGGQQRTSNISFFPLYLVTTSQHVMQIGVYEMPSLEAPEDGELDISELSISPLLYDYATSEFILEHRIVPPEEEEEIQKEEDEEEELQKEEEDVEVLEEEKTQPQISVPSIRKPETRDAAQIIRAQYVKQVRDNWLQKFMLSPYYGLVDNEGMGDCMFATIRDALKSIGKDVSVADMRQQLAEHLTPEVFAAYKDRYDMLNAMLHTFRKDSTTLKKDYDAKKAQITDTNLSFEDKKKVYEEAVALKHQHSDMKEQYAFAKENIADVQFMKSIHTMADMRAAIMTRHFWGDSWAISMLERTMNIKLIIMSKSRWDLGDMDNVLQCGEFFEVPGGKFTPDAYIIVELSGIHYQLVEYKGRQIFDFSGLPYDLRVMVVHKCMERNSGMFSTIPDFTAFKDTLGRSSLSSPSLSSFATTYGGAMKSGNDSMFVLYATSAHDPPGKGPGEKLCAIDQGRFYKLAATPHWRRKLSDSWEEAPFDLDGMRWTSVDHAVIASQYTAHPAFSQSFSLDSGEERGASISVARAAISRGAKPPPKDADWGTRGVAERQRAQHAKFSQNAKLKDVLCATHPARLTNHRRKHPPSLAIELTDVRDEFV